MNKNVVKMPEKIKIDIIEFEVKKVEPLISDGVTVAGIINYVDSIIKISSDRSEIQQKITMMHEIIHGIINARGIEKQFTDEQLETICDAMALGLIQVIRDNKELIEYIK